MEELPVKEKSRRDTVVIVRPQRVDIIPNIANFSSAAETQPGYHKMGLLYRHQADAGKKTKHNPLLPELHVEDESSAGDICMT